MQSESGNKASKQAVWELSSQNPVLANRIKEALRAVEDPELGYNVIELGLIRNVTGRDGRIVVTMILTTPFCPYAGEMIEDVRAAATDVSVDPVFVDLCFDPWDPTMMEEGMDFDWGLF